MFQKIKPEDITDNIFLLINVDWTLIAAGDSNKYNMINKPIAQKLPNLGCTVKKKKSVM